MTPADLTLLCPAGCRFGIDRIDQSWRLSAWGRRHARAWQLWGVEGAAKELLRLAWRQAIDEGYETKCPFENLGV